MISPHEFQNAAIVALEENIALSREDLLVETARLLGFGRTGKDIATALAAAISKPEFKAKVTIDHAGRLRLADG